MLPSLAVRACPSFIGSQPSAPTRYTATRAARPDVFAWKPETASERQRSRECITGLLGRSSANVAVGVARWEYENKTKKHVLDCELWPRGELSKAGMEQWVSSPTLAGHNSVCGRLTVGEKKLSGLREAEDEKGLEHG